MKHKVLQAVAIFSMTSFNRDKDHELFGCPLGSAHEYNCVEFCSLHN